MPLSDRAASELGIGFEAVRGRSPRLTILSSRLRLGSLETTSGDQRRNCSVADGM